MAFKTAAVSVGTTATRLTTFDPKYNDSDGAYDVLIVNNGAATVYVGGSDVTTANGIPVAAGASLSVSREADLYGRVASGTVECRVGSMGVA